MSSNLATKLRVGTKKAHTMAENVGFVKCFLKGVVEKNSYRKLVANFYFAYTAMEEELEKHSNHPVVSKIDFKELYRQRSLEQDLSYYYGANWREQIKLSPAGQEYVNRIREVSQNEPLGKPHPGVYLTTAEKLGVSPQNCLALEDSLNGVLAAKAAQMKCIAIPEMSELHNPKFAIADMVLESLQQLDDNIWDFVNT
ncbi:MAG: HAD-IA family hydrolase [Cyanobacteria bacterium J06636_27]